MKAEYCLNPNAPVASLVTFVAILFIFGAASARGQAVGLFTDEVLIAAADITFTDGALPDATIDDLIEQVDASGLSLRQKRPLLAALEAARASIEEGRCESATHQLRAFQNKVRAQLGGPDTALAQTLIAAAQSVLDSECEVADGLPRFAIRDLEVLTGVEFMAAVKINNQGQVLGNGYGTQGSLQPFLYSHGVVTPLNVGEGGGTAYNFNDRGQVVGVGRRASGHYFFLYHDGSVTDLSAAIGQPITRIMDINNDGVIVGGVLQSGGPDPFPTYARGFVYDGQFRLLELLPSGLYSDAISINNFGDIAGQSSLLVGGRRVGHAVVWNQQGVIDLGTLPSTTHSVNWAINDRGQMAGYSDSHGFFYTAGQMIPMDNLPGHFYSTPREINSRGHVVGASADAHYGEHRGFIYLNGVMYDLNDLIPQRSGWFIQWAEGINDRSEIVGMGIYQNRPRAFLLKPLGRL